MIRILGTIFAAALGLAFGSFLNVCLSRWPAGESIVLPRSHCRHCHRTLAWWENIPLLSWLVLRCRCRTCKCWIGWLYPLVEAAVGGLWAVCAAQAIPERFDVFLPTSFIVFECVSTAALMLFLWLLVALAALDAENLWLPNWLTLPGAALGLLIATVHPFLFELLGTASDRPLTEEAQSFSGIKIGLWLDGFERLAAMLAAAGLILLIRWLYWLVRRREGIGLGDAKLMALLAAWLGLPGALLAFGLGVGLGSVAALLLLLIPRAAATPEPVSTADSSSTTESQPASTQSAQEPWSQKKLPLGTFLCLGGIVSALWGEPLIAAYLRWAGF
jgi:leader peptidase (prepilin peptidase)/N-methyltransferase